MWFSASDHEHESPSQTFASTHLSIVPHLAEDEHLLSDLGGIQGVKKCNLPAENFVKVCELHKYPKMAGVFRRSSAKKGADHKPMHRKHGFMHTRNTAGINANHATDIEINYTWSPHLARPGPASNDESLKGPESITPDDFDAAFDELDRRLKEAPRNSEMVSEMERIDKGLTPLTFQEDVQLVGSNSSSSSWDVEALLMSSGTIVLHFQNSILSYARS